MSGGHIVPYVRLGDCQAVGYRIRPNGQVRVRIGGSQPCDGSLFRGQVFYNPKGR